MPDRVHVCLTYVLLQNYQLHACLPALYLVTEEVLVRSFSLVDRSRLTAIHVMFVLFLSNDVTTVSVDMAEGGVTGTSVNWYPS